MWLFCEVGGVRPVCARLLLLEGVPCFVAAGDMCVMFVVGVVDWYVRDVCTRRYTCYKRRGVLRCRLKSMAPAFGGGSSLCVRSSSFCLAVVPFHVYGRPSLRSRFA